ncbi:unnamed protein product [Clonostachys rosea f. rosea IK726]|uniref:Uncharacterized protein n=2 Tax=Bionectria ochroleuca TaxID=29856 RepID=A0A0B7KIJ3_BIOOC|nr:unnamed protein product [Clonostachys rosea f. rosea IK726]
MHFTKAIFSIFTFSALAAGQLYERELAGEDPAMIVRELRDDYLVARDYFMEARDLLARAPSLGVCKSAGKSHPKNLSCMSSQEYCGTCKTNQKAGEACFCKEGFVRDQSKLPPLKKMVGKELKNGKKA